MKYDNIEPVHYSRRKIAKAALVLVEEWEDRVDESDREEAVRSTDSAGSGSAPPSPRG